MIEERNKRRMMKTKNNIREGDRRTKQRRMMKTKNNRMLKRKNIIRKLIERRNKEE